MSSREEAKGETGQGKKEKRKEKKKKERNGREEKKEEDAAAAAVAAAAESPRSRSARPSLSAAPAAGSPRGRPAPPAGPASCPLPSSLSFLGSAHSRWPACLSHLGCLRCDQMPVHSVLPVAGSHIMFPGLDIKFLPVGAPLTSLGASDMLCPLSWVTLLI